MRDEAGPFSLGATTVVRCELSRDETICSEFGTWNQTSIDRVAPNSIPKEKKFEEVPTGGKIMATEFLGWKRNYSCDSYA